MDIVSRTYVDGRKKRQKFYDVAAAAIGPSSAHACTHNTANGDSGYNILVTIWRVTLI